ncbi:MAG: hypothetical protein IJ115_03320 [Erysipelotrichaceae bacterium]|nr:hypothetical protein [Erysipelotrichaceae bacterium]
MKLFSKKNKDLKQLEMTDEISDEELTKEGYEVNEPEETVVYEPISSDTKEADIIETREFSTIASQQTRPVVYQNISDEEEEDDEEYEYITPHYGLNAFMITVLFILIGAGLTFLLTRNILTESIRQGYIDAGYINTRDATATAADVAFGKKAYSYLGEVDGSYVEIDTSNATATPEDILLGYTAYVDGKKITGSIPTFTPATTYSPGSKDTIIPKGYYLKGSIFIKAENNLKPENIRDGVSIFDVKGTYKYEGN